ncbi:MAG: AAA family ATPase [Nanoarchaeota archaeon]
MRINPFNPQQPARPDFFIGREPEITAFEKFLRQTISGSPMNMSITGNRGIGKTSLLIKLEESAKKEKCLAIRLSNYEGNVSGIIDFSEFLSSNIEMEILSKRPLERGLKSAAGWIASLKPAIEWKDIKLSVEKKQIVQELLRQRLLNLWAEIKKDFKAAVILIDEAESLEKIEGIFSFMREVFQRINMDANYMVVLSGKLHFPERMSESFSPLNRFFPAYRLEPFKYKEIGDYIKRKLASLEISISENAVKSIALKSEGHPYVLVSMCYIIFDSLLETENEITEDIIKRATPKISFELAKDFFSPIYHPLTPRAKEILMRIAKNAKQLEFSFSEAIKWTGEDSNYLSPYIQEMLRKGVINKPERGKYTFFHGAFLEYLKGIQR